MKPQFYLLGAAAVLSLGACSQDDARPEPSDEGYTLTFTVAEDDTRTTLATSDILRWVYTDRVGIYTVGENLNPNTLTVADVNQSPVEFIGILKRPVTPGDRFYAYYPYDAAQTADPAAVTLSIPVAQKQVRADVYNGESNPLVALPMEFPGVQDSYACRMSSVRFKQLGAIVELQLYASDEAIRNEAIRSVTFEADAPLAGEFPFDLTAVTAKDELTISGYESETATVALEQPAAIPADKEDGARVYLTIAPGTYSGSIVVKTDVAHYTFKLAKPLTFERAVIKGMAADLARAKRVLLPEAPIRFEDPEVKRICVENWDTNGDGELSYAEAAAVTAMNDTPFPVSITSFDELQYFINLKTIKSHTFSNAALQSIIIPNGVMVESQAFWLNQHLKRVTVGEDVRFGEVGAFPGSNQLEVFYGKYATEDHRCLVINGELVGFAGAGLIQYTLPDNIVKIGARVFPLYDKLEKIVIPQGVKEIKECTFWGCSSLTDVTIPFSVASIGDSAFCDCANLQSVTFLGVGTEVGRGVFNNCDKITGFYTNNGGYEYGLCAYDKRYLTYNKILVAVASCDLTECEIPYYVVAIGDKALSQCRNLTSIVIPDKVISIGEEAFWLCRSLTSVTIPDRVTEIGSDAFAGCRSLTSIYCKPINPPTSGSDTFREISSEVQFYVPTASVEAYKTAPGWSQYADRIVGYDFQ